MIFTVFCCFIACIVLYGLVTKIHNRRRVDDIPTLSGINVFIRLVSSKFDIIKSFQLLNKKYGDIFRSMSVVTIANPQYMEVFHTCPALQYRPRNNGFYALIGKPNLITVKAERSRILKKFYLRYFVNVSHIESLKISANDLVKQLHKSKGTRWIHATDYTKEAVATAVIRNAFGVELEDYPKLRKTILELEHYLIISMLRDVSPFHRNDFLFYNFLGGRKLMEAKSNINETVSKIIKRKQREMTELEKEGKEVPSNFIFGILRERETDEAININSELSTLLLTALDTTSIAISFALIMLGMHPEIQEKVFEEDKRIQKELAGREMEDGDLIKYEYTQRVIKETLRLYPPAPAILRTAMADVKMGQFLIPKGTVVAGSMISVQRDPNIFDNPLKFDPDRFLPENARKLPKHAYVPFGAGIRGCPGSRYGHSSTTYFLTAIVRNFKIYTKYQSIGELDKNIASSVTLFDVKHNFPIFLETRSQT